MSDIYELSEAIEAQTNEWLEQNMQPLTPSQAEKAGLDHRAIGNVMFNDTTIAAVGEKSIRALEYYGGFEYVDSEATLVVGNVKFYMDADNRVARHLAEMTYTGDDSDE